MRRTSANSNSVLQVSHNHSQEFEEDDEDKYRKADKEGHGQNNLLLLWLYFTIGIGSYIIFTATLRNVSYLVSTNRAAADLASSLGAFKYDLTSLPPEERLFLANHGELIASEGGGELSVGKIPSFGYDYATAIKQKASGTPSSAETEGEARISASDSVSSTTTEEASRPKGPKDGNKPEPERATQQDEKDAGKDSDTTTRMSDGKDSDTTPRMSDGKDRKEGIDQGDRAEHDSNKATEKNAKPTEDSGPKKDQKPESDKNKEKSSTTPAPPKDKKTKISKADPSSSDVSADRGVAVPHKCMGSNITAMRMEESEDGTLFIMDFWLVRKTKQIAMMVPPPSVVEASGQSLAQQTPLLDMAPEPNEGNEDYLRCSFPGGVSTKVEVVGQQFIRNWNDEANKGKPHDIFTVMLLCTVPDDIWKDTHSGEMGVTYVLENTKYAEGSPGYRIGELTACVVPNPPKGTHLACTSPTQITASTAAGLRAAEWMEYHNLLGIEHYILYLDYPSKETQAVLDIYLDNGMATGVQWRSLVDRSLDTVALTETSKTANDTGKAKREGHRWYSVKMPFMRLQTTAHRHCLWKFGEFFEWAWFFDFDEYLQPIAASKLEGPVTGKELDELMRPHLNSVACMHDLHGPEYDSQASGLTVDGITLMERCIYRTEGGTEQVTGGSKAKVRPLAVASSWFSVGECWALLRPPLATAILQ
mmetsp:Transcript_6490/g.24114  ORF Transcript_6490/g.24114 Transcript_6490/m.24114 type:complete len:703 (+) Transcript_6490:268-2376(+)